MADLRGNRRQRPPPILDVLPSFSMAVLACNDVTIDLVVFLVILIDVFVDLNYPRRAPHWGLLVLSVGPRPVGSGINVS